MTNLVATSSKELTAEIKRGMQDITTLLTSSYAPSTVGAYKTDQDTFIQLTNKDLVKATPLDISTYVKELKAKGYAPSTISRKVHSLSKLLDILAKAGYRQGNPVQELKSIKKNLIPKQVRRIDATLTTADLHKIKAHNTRTSLLIELLYTTGARISEVLAIKKQDIKKHNETTSKVEITGKGNKARTLFISNYLLSRIQATYTLDSEYLVHTQRGRQASRINEYKKIKSYIQKLTGKDAHPHQLRHLYATTQIVANKKSVKAVSKYLGHSTTAITQDMYVDDTLNSDEAIL